MRQAGMICCCLMIRKCFGAEAVASAPPPIFSYVSRMYFSIAFLGAYDNSKTPLNISKLVVKVRKNPQYSSFFRKCNTIHIPHYKQWKQVENTRYISDFGRTREQSYKEPLETQANLYKYML